MPCNESDRLNDLRIEVERLREELRVARAALDNRITEAEGLKTEVERLTAGAAAMPGTHRPLEDQ